MSHMLKLKIFVCQLIFKAISLNAKTIHEYISINHEYISTLNFNQYV